MGIFDFFRGRKPERGDDHNDRQPPPAPPGISLHEALARLETLRRRASIAEIGGFRPPDDPRASWFGRGVGLAGETLPTYEGRELFPLLQINVAELPYVPPELEGAALLVLFFDEYDFPFDRPNGEGWLMREYASLDGLVPLPAPRDPLPVKPFPIRWHVSESEAPSWESGHDLVGTGPAPLDDPEDRFFDACANHDRTKVGGYPTEIQSAVPLENFVLQVGSESKPGWHWVDEGCAYFYRAPDGTWSWDCQFH